MASRGRLTVFAVLIAACVLGTAAAIGSAVREGDGAASGSAAARTLLSDSRTDGRPVVAFRSLGRQKAHGQVAVAALARRSGPPALTPLACDRVHFAAGKGLCLGRGSGFAGGYRAVVFDAGLRVRHEVPVAGIPSRARVSPDGRYGSVTLFVTGHAYAAAGSFSTQTTLIDMERGKKIAGLEQFTVTRAGKQVTAADVNFWGVTFARDSDRFYATLATGGKTYLIQGSVSGRTAHVLHENVECPSLSPDGTRIAFKKRTGSRARPWRLTVLDLETMRETPLAERRSVDDQAEWLDDGHILYGLGGSVWMVRADGGGRPVRYLPDADSPAVVGASPG
jgi:WD40-like Beta Propeller Repeat